ncbi:MAG: UDP-forming cellulose synthase catalytic subunit [Gallionella sp.]|nr:UDP-forming cellulose synthase catalytic subunit [Gallionella sp.]
MKLQYLMADIRSNSRSWTIAASGILLIGILFYFIQFIYAYIDQTKQMYLGWGCFIAIFLMYRIKKFHVQPWRFIFILLAAFMALRYIQWRAFDTLIYTGPLDFIAMALLFLAEVYGLIIYFLGMFVNIWPLESKHVPLPDETGRLPTVDIFIPTYNESDEIIRITATAASQLDYPKEKFRIYIIDDGGTQAKRNHPDEGMSAWARHYRIRQMADELGIGYITRETNQQAKAGNINHALQYTDGDLVLILDCDHVPTRDILQNTVGHFVADPKLFLVQTPHFFINPTPVEKSLDGIANPSGENDMFYRSIHPALNFWNASYFCGSAAVLRRKYLLEVGGICGTTITEDAETAFQLHSRGYNSIYVNKPMVCGLSPESYDDYVVQRSRWAQGMIQLILLKNPLKAKGLSLPQKIAYFNSSFFWFFGFPRFIYFIAPASYLIFGLNVYHASWLQILSITVPYVLSIYVVMDFFYARTRQPFFSEIYESVQSLFLMPAVLSVLLNPWKPSFKVTPKGIMNSKEYLSTLAAPFFLAIAVNLVAVLLASIKWFTEPILREVILVTGVWCIYNLYLAIMSLGAFWERKQIRKFYRINASGTATAYFPGMGTYHIGEVRDVSMSGIGFEIALPFQPREHDPVVLQVKDSYGREYRFENKILRTVSQGGKYFCGSEFMTDRVSYANVVSYVFGDSLRWQDVWDQKSKSRGTYRMLRHLLIAGIKGFIGGVFPLLVDALLRFWKLTVKWLSTSILRDRSLGAANWCVYYFYLALASLVEMLNQKQVRKLQRISTSGAATIYIPRLDATLMGELADFSLSGIGVVVELPFELNERERVTIRTEGRDGKECQFECFISRTIKLDTKSLCGTEFIVDVFSYPKIVKFVYGDSLHMLRYLLMPCISLAAQGKAVTKKIIVLVSNVFVRVLKTPAQVFALLFLNPAYRAKITKERKS